MIQNKQKVYFKQYGAQRTGTNYIKRLLELNFSNAVVFSNLLGWKHGLYHLKSHRNSEQAANHLDWINKKYNPKINKVLCSDEICSSYSKSELEKACSKINYIISYRPLAAYIYSYKIFRHPKKTFYDINIEKLCKEYVEDYKTWFLLPNSIKINSIDLLDDEKLYEILNNIKNKFDLQPKNENFLNEKRIIKASTESGLIIDSQEFDKDFYLEKKYLKLIPNDIKKIINKYVIF